MSNKYFFQILFILLVLLLSACASQSGDTEQARQALTGFFDALSKGHYSDAVSLYGGSYEILVGYNPEISPDDQAALWQNAARSTACSASPFAAPHSRSLIQTESTSSPSNSTRRMAACLSAAPAAAKNQPRRPSSNSNTGW